MRLIILVAAGSVALIALGVAVGQYGDARPFCDPGSVLPWLRC
jgi:hypothetical protein